MKIYDITQELFSCQVYPGDTPPTYKQVQALADDKACNLTDISMCSHNATHIDAPAHYIENGKTIDQLPLDIFVGAATITEDLPSAEELLQTTRLLIKGKKELTIPEATLLSNSNLQLIGVESQSVGSPEVHRILLSAGIALLEGITLSHVPEGQYTLIAPPLKLGGLEGAPCRAMLVEEAETSYSACFSR